MYCAQKSDCRNYATSIAPSTGGRITCKFDEKSAQNRCTGGSVNSLYAYTGIDQFIDEGRAMGRRRWETILISGGESRRTDTFYSSEKRVLSTVTSYGTASSSGTALEWDSLQRTIKYASDYDSGTGTTCKNRIEVMTYNDADRTVTGQMTYAQSIGTGSYAGSPCAGLTDLTYTYRYDSDNELIAADSTTYSILAKAEVCQ